MPRAAMLLVAAINVVCAVGVYVVGHAGYRIAATVSYSRFHDLEVHHAIAINPPALKAIANSGLTDPADVHPFLIEGFATDQTVFDVAAFALVMNGVIWMIAGWRYGRRTSRDSAAQTKDN